MDTSRIITNIEKIISLANIDEIEGILENNTDISQYLNEKNEQSQQAHEELIENLIINFDKIIKLHHELSDVSERINVVDKTLLHFSKNLENISSQMMDIQKKCSNTSHELKGRHLIKNEIVKLVDKLVITERMITAINSTPVTEQEFIEQMHELNYKISFIKEMENIPTSSSNESIELINKLKITCIGRLNNYFISQFNHVLSNVDNLPTVKNALTHLRFLIEFIKLHDELTYEDLIRTYIQTIKKISDDFYKKYFKTLFDSAEHTSAPNLIGIIKKRNSKKQTFMLGNRSTVISTELDAKVIKLEPSVFKTYSLEVILRSSYFLIMSNSCEEYEFLIDFFLMNEESALETVIKIFYSSMVFLTTITETALSDCTDIICLLLSTSLFKRFNTILYNRSFTQLKNFLDIVIEKSWCRFSAVVSLHIESFRSNDIPSAISYDQCHIVTQRTSGLLSAIYGLISDFEPNKLALLFTQLVQEWDSFISIEASIFDDRNMQLVYEIVNYNMVLNMINVQPHIPLIFKDLKIEYIHEESIPICNEIVNVLRKKYKNMIYQICHDHLFQFFGDMIAFINNPNPKMHNGAQKVLTISMNFTSTWKNSLMVISTDLKKLFIKNYLDQELIEACFSIFIEFYKEYSLIISNSYPDVMKQLNEKGKVVDIQNILIEMKKYR